MSELQEHTDAIVSFREQNPQLFKEKRRAPDMLRRAAFWLVGIALGTWLDWMITGTASNPVLLAAGMIVAALWVYFDPPTIRTTYTLRGPTP